MPAEEASSYGASAGGEPYGTVPSSSRSLRSSAASVLSARGGGLGGGGGAGAAEAAGDERVAPTVAAVESEAIRAVAAVRVDCWRRLGGCCRTCRDSPRGAKGVEKAIHGWLKQDWKPMLMTRKLACHLWWMLVQTSAAARAGRTKPRNPAWSNGAGLFAACGTMKAGA